MGKEDIKLIPEVDTADLMREGKGQYMFLIRHVCVQSIYCRDGRLPKTLKSISKTQKHFYESRAKHFSANSGTNHADCISFFLNLVVKQIGC